MNDRAIQELDRLLRQDIYLYENPRRCRAALADACFELEAERRVLATLHDIGVAGSLLDLQNSRSNEPVELRVGRVAREAAQRTGLSEAWLQWGVFGWARVAGLSLPQAHLLRPLIISFEAVLAPDGTVDLAWDVFGDVQEVFIDPYRQNDRHSTPAQAEGGCGDIYPEGVEPGGRAHGDTYAPVAKSRH